MIRFREHRGSLADSLATTVTVTSRAELIAHVARLLDPIPVTSEQLGVAPYCFDARIGWETHIVTLRDYGVVGFTDADVL
jgi:hypothetical protein